MTACSVIAKSTIPYKRLWFIAGNIAVPMVEVSAEEMARIRGSAPEALTGFPVYWARGQGTWPSHASNGAVVQEIRWDEI